MHYFIGVDVGSSSTRAGLFDSNGALIDFVKKDIKIFSDDENIFYEQSSDEIWTSVCSCINQIIVNTGIDKSDILSIGFDATCSLVVLDKNKRPLSVSRSNDNNRNVIMWMDHRAKIEADFINSKELESLKYCGGKISPEMDPPKILWLKRNLHDECYKKAEHFMSLPDYLFWKCTNVDIRSMCCVVCKWLFNANENGENKWDTDFWHAIGLGDLSDDNFAKIGARIREPFGLMDPDENRLCTEASHMTGLSINTKVGVSLIDAHSGGIGALSKALGALDNIGCELALAKYEEILVIVSGTSACHMATSSQALYVNGVWGPYYSAMLPGMWLNEGGQSACGMLLDHIITNSKVYEELRCSTQSTSIFETLNSIILKLAKDNGIDSKNFGMLTQNFHIYPDFHGNRSPLNDPNMTGSICGLTLNESVENLAVVYLSALQALAFQTKQIVERLISASHCPFKLIVIIGGLAKNDFYTQTHSDICGIPVCVPEDAESIVLLGSCISGAFRTNDFANQSFDSVLKRLSGSATSVKLLYPNTNESITHYYQKKFKVFLAMLNDQSKYNSIMAS